MKDKHNTSPDSRQPNDDSNNHPSQAENPAENPAPPAQPPAKSTKSPDPATAPRTGEAAYGPLPAGLRPFAGKCQRNPLDYESHPHPSMKRFAELLALRFNTPRTRHSYYRQISPCGRLPVRRRAHAARFAAARPVAAQPPPPPTSGPEYPRMTSFTYHHHRQGLLRNRGQGRASPRPRVAENLLWVRHGGPEHQRGDLVPAGIATIAALRESPQGFPVMHCGGLTDRTPVQNAPAFGDSAKVRQGRATRRSGLVQP